MVMGGDLRPRGCGFESWRQILDGHYIHNIDEKNCNVCLTRPIINDKIGRERTIQNK